jgi:hypothetical protein
VQDNFCYVLTAPAGRARACKAKRRYCQHVLYLREQSTGKGSQLQSECQGSFSGSFAPQEAQKRAENVGVNLFPNKI